MKTRIALLGLVALGFVSIAQAGAIYDPAVDWSISDNPNGVWSYRSGSGTLFDTGAVIGGDGGAVERWSAGGSSDPCITYNPTSEEVVGWLIHWAPYEIGMGSSGDSNGIILRWTAPSAGNWAVDALFTTTQEGNIGGTIYVAKNGTEVFSHGVGNYLDSSSYADTLSFAAGETLDFRVTGDKFVRPEITISQVPEPCSLVLVVLGGIGILAYAWRKRK